MSTDTYAAAPALALAISGARGARRHFAAEYCAASSSARVAPDVHVDVRFTARLPVGLPRGGVVLARPGRPGWHVACPCP